MSTAPIPPILSLLIGHIAAAVPRRARITFTELLLGAAATRGGHVTDAILAGRVSRSWTTYDWLLQRGRWTWRMHAAKTPSGARVDLVLFGDGARHGQDR